jgi:nucleotide-binding universal stress UspA family protein
MSMKSVLVPLEDPETAGPILSAALVFARRYGSQLEGVATLPILDNYIVGEMVPLWPPQQRSTTDLTRDVSEAFRGFMSANTVASRDAGGAGPTWTWREPPLLGDSAVASAARVFDITVVGRPTSGALGPRLSLLETVIFESGRPILIAPPSPPASIGESILIAWNCSTETARATALAGPLLRQARRVLVLTVEGGTVSGPPGEELARSLRLNGIETDAVTIPGTGSSSGEAILQHCEAWGADLLIKGAYTQSRLRQMIFGGATSHVLAHARLPVFMAH